MIEEENEQLMAEKMYSNLVDDSENDQEKENALRDFHIQDLLQIIEDVINNEEYNIEELITKINNF